MQRPYPIPLLPNALFKMKQSTTNYALKIGAVF